MSAKTPGYASRLAIWFQATKTGRRRAYYFSTLAGRVMPVPMADAEMFIALDQADQIDGNPLKSI